MSFFVFLLTGTSSAEDGIVVDRPSVGTASSVVSKGTVQVEAGLQIESDSTVACDDCFVSVTNASYALPTMLRLGLHDRFEMRYYSSIIVVDKDVQALEGSGLQGKISLYAPEDKPLSLSLLASGELDIDDGGGGATMLLDFWGEQWSGWVNVGHTTAYEDASTSILLVEGFGIPLPNNQGIFIENAITFEQGDISSSVEGGFYKTYEDFQWDVYALSSVTERNSWQVATGIAWRIP